MFHHLKLDRAGIGAAWRDEEIAHYTLLPSYTKNE